jgi:hypothetical protein
MSIKCGNCGETHLTVADVRACCACECPPDEEPKEFGLPASSPIVKAIRGDSSLPIRDRGRNDFAGGESRAVRSGGGVFGTKSAKRDYTEPVAEGFYRANGQIFRVVPVKNGEGRRYAKLLVLHGPEEKPTYEYSRGTIAQLKPGQRMSAEDVAKLSLEKQLVHCLMCGKKLTNAISRELGIGPICREKY